MTAPTLTDLYRAIEADAKRNSAEATAARREFGLDPAPVRPPFWIDIRSETEIVESKAAGGDIHAARKMRDAENAAVETLGYRAVLTDSTGRVLS